MGRALEKTGKAWTLLAAFILLPLAHAMGSENYIAENQLADRMEMSSESFGITTTLSPVSNSTSETYEALSLVTGGSIKAEPTPSPEPQQPSAPATAVSGGGGGEIRADFELSPSQIDYRLKPGEAKQISIRLKNTGGKKLEISLGVSGDASNVLFLQKTYVELKQNEYLDIPAKIVSSQPGRFSGSIQAKAENIIKSISVSIAVISEESLLDMKATIAEKKIARGGKLSVHMDIFNLGSTARVDVVLKYWIEKDGKTINPKTETLAIETQASISRFMGLEALEEGEYQFRAVAEYEGKRAESRDTFHIVSEAVQEAPEKKEELGERFSRLENAVLAMLVVMAIIGLLIYRRGLERHRGGEVAGKQKEK